MKATGITRKLDQLGRIVLPKELRDSMGIEEGTPMEIFTDSEEIIIRKYEPGCIFCGSVENTKAYEKKNICTSCIKTIISNYQAKG